MFVSASQNVSHECVSGNMPAKRRVHSCSVQLKIVVCGCWCCFCRRRRRRRLRSRRRRGCRIVVVVFVVVDAVVVPCGGLLFVQCWFESFPPGKIHRARLVGTRAPKLMDIRC